jgi:nicotinamidase-related amidase
MNPALVLIDIQHDYFPNGRMEVAGAVEASRAAARLLTYFRKKNLPVVHIQHISTRAGATYFLPDTEGINIHESVKPLTDETIIRKHFPNSFRDTDLQEYLEFQGIRDLVICGMMSHMCIDATVRAAFDKGYTCMVAHDACAAIKLVFNGNDISAMNVHGAYMAAIGAVYAKVLTSEEIIRII